MSNYYSWWVGQKKTKLMLFSTQVEVVVEVGVELGKRIAIAGLRFSGRSCKILDFSITLN